MDGDSRGGNDTLIGGVGAGSLSFMSLYGDAFGDARPRPRRRRPSDRRDWHSQPKLYGDAGIIDGDGRGGDDTIIGGGGSVDFIYGDAGRCTTTPVAATTRPDRGGPSFTNNLIHGDAGSIDGDSRGGNDTLIGRRYDKRPFFLNDRFWRCRDHA